MGQVEHGRRARFSGWRPHNVTVRLTLEAARLGRRRLHGVIRAVFCATCGASDFRIVHYSVQRNHVHLVVEARGRSGLTRGMRSTNIRIGKRVNAALGRRRGRVIEHRYHARELKTPTEVRNAIRYVLGNYRKHLWRERGERCGRTWLDPCSSGQYFDGWRHGPAPKPIPRNGPVVVARTALVRERWRRRGLIDLDDVPAAS